MSRKFLKGTIIGGIIGAAGGLLMAPNKGRQSRQELKKRGLAYKKQAEQKGEELGTAWQKFSQGFSQETARYTDRLKKVLNQATAHQSKPKPKTKAKPRPRTKK